MPARQKRNADISTFAPEGVLVIPPQVKANAVVRQVTAEVSTRAERSNHSRERVDIEIVD